MGQESIREKNGEGEITYRIGELSRLTGVKAGTIRFYEKCGFMGAVGRTANNYRIYNRRHVFQIRVCRLVFGGFVNRRLRRESLKVLRASAEWNLAAYGKAGADYLKAVEEDLDRTRKAIAICAGQMGREEMEEGHSMEEKHSMEERHSMEETRYSKKQAAAMTGVTPETIRGWERNGLLGQFEPYERRHYGQALLNRMYAIRLLLDTGYSMMAVRAFVQAYDQGHSKQAEQLLIDPREDEGLRYRSDRYLKELERLREKALQLSQMKSEMESI